MHPLHKRKSLQRGEWLKPTLDMVESHPNVEEHDVRMGHPNGVPKIENEPPAQNRDAFERSRSARRSGAVDATSTRFLPLFLAR